MFFLRRFCVFFIFIFKNCILLCNFFVFCVNSVQRLLIIMKGVIAIITLFLNSDKSLTAVNHSKIYYGENRIGEIKIVAPDTIGNKSFDECELTLYVLFDDYYINYSLGFSGKTCIVPITDDITEAVGDHEMFIEITADRKVLGRTNSVNLKVYPFNNKETEIIKREVYIAQIEELTEKINSDESDFEDIKSALIFKNMDVDDDTPTSEYGDIIRDIPSVSAERFAKVIDNSLTGTFEIPKGTTNIKEYAFYKSQISEFILPSSIRTINANGFSNNYNLTDMDIPEGVTYIGNSAFTNCQNMTRVHLPSTLTELGNNVFVSCAKLKTLNIPASVTSLSPSMLQSCYLLEYLTIENGFNAQNLNIAQSYSQWFTTETIVGWLNALADRTGLSTYTLTLGTYCLNKLTAEQKAIATNKNWNLA